MTGSSNLKSYYNIVFDQQFSPFGKHLATSDIFGQIAVFSLSSALDSTNQSSGKAASRLLKGHRGPAYSLCNAGSLLVSGGTQELKAWKWEELVGNSEAVDPVVTLSPPISAASPVDINGLAYDKQSQTIFSAGGNGKIFSWDLSAGKLKGTFSGHKGCIYCVCMRTGSQQFITGGEDGAVYVWDPSASNSPVHTIKAGDGRWIGCVAVDQSGEWMVYGGSDAPVVFHLGSMNKILSLPVPDGVVSQGAIFAKDNIITVGSEPTVRHWTVNGLPVAAVPGGHNHAFSVAFNDSSVHYEVLAVSGDSSDVNIFTNFGYKAFSLSVC
eukprot:Em0015g472a